MSLPVVKTARQLRHDRRSHLRSSAYVDCWLLTKLPPELRQMIYLEFLKDRQLGLSIAPKDKKVVLWCELRPTNPPFEDGAPLSWVRIRSRELTSILRVCRQMRQEALPTFQERIIVNMYSLQQCVLFRDYGGKSFLNGMKRLRVQSFPPHYHGLFSKVIRVAFPDLKALRLVNAPKSQPIVATLCRSVPIADLDEILAIPWAVEKKLFFQRNVESLLEDFNDSKADYTSLQEVSLISEHLATWDQWYPSSWMGPAWGIAWIWARPITLYLSSTLGEKASSAALWTYSMPHRKQILTRSTFNLDTS